MSQHQKAQCKNCDTFLQGPICHQCGQKQIIERWSTADLIRQFFHEITNIEKGFLYTAKGLFAFPGKLIRGYWNGKTINSYNPFRYVLILSAINLLINFWLGIDDLLQASLQPEILEEEFGAAKMQAVDQQFDSWMNILVLLLIPINSLISKWLFKKHEQNYAEHLILNAYIIGQQSLISSFTQFVFYFFPALFSGYLAFNFLVSLLYNTYLFNQLFNEGINKTFLKAILIGVLGIAAFFILVLISTSIAFAFS